MQELVHPFFALDVGKKTIILPKISRGFTGSVHQQIWHEEGGAPCIQPLPLYLHEGKSHQTLPCHSSPKQERFPGHCPELNSLGSDIKNNQSGLQFYLPLKLTLLKKHITLDFWPVI